MPIHNEHQFFQKHLFQVPLADDTLPFPPFYFLLPIIPLPARTSEGYLWLSVTWNPTPASAPVVDYGSITMLLISEEKYVFQQQSENCPVSIVITKWRHWIKQNKKAFQWKANYPLVNRSRGVPRVIIWNRLGGEASARGLHAVGERAKRGSMWHNWKHYLSINYVCER